MFAKILIYEVYLQKCIFAGGLRKTELSHFLRKEPEFFQDSKSLLYQQHDDDNVATYDDDDRNDDDDDEHDADQIPHNMVNFLSRGFRFGKVVDLSNTLG